MDIMALTKFLIWSAFIFIAAFLTELLHYIFVEVATSLDRMLFSMLELCFILGALSAIVIYISERID